MPQHLTSQQIEDLIARRLAPVELLALARHLSACESCRTAVNEPARTAERLSQLHSIFAEKEQEPLRRRWFAWLVQLNPMPLAFAGSALAVLIVAGWWMSHLMQKANPIQPTNIAQSPPKISTTPIPTETPTEPIATQIVLADNRQQIGLDQTGKLFGLPELPEDLSRAVQEALQTQKLATSAEIKDLHSRPATLMSGDTAQPSFPLLTPVGVIIATNQPEFRWHALPDAESYVVTILDSDFNLIETSQALTQPVWRLPRALKRGQTYAWQVTATVAGQPVKSSSATAAEARFKILSADQSRRVRQLADQYADSHLLLGTLYAQAGLLADAEREFLALLKANQQSAVARKLLHRARTLRAN